jgi:DNA-binding MarR family transcriptional regulator
MSNEWITWVLKDAPIDDTTETFMMFVLADSSNPEGVCYPSKKTMAKYMRMSPRSIARLIASLEEKTLVQRVERRRDTDGGQTSNYYQLHQRTRAEVEKAVKDAEMRRKADKEGVTPMTPPHDAHDTPPMTGVTSQGVTPVTSQEPLVVTQKEPEKETTLQPAIADRADTASASHTSPLANEADDETMFKRFPAQAEKRTSSPATAPSPSLKPKSPTAQNTTAPIPHSAAPLSPADAPVSVDDVEKFSSKLEQDKGKKAAKPESPAQAAQRIKVESMVACGFVMPVSSRSWSNFKGVLKTLDEVGMTQEMYADYVKWVRAISASQNNWTVSINSLAEKNRPENYMAERAKKAISRDSTGTQVSTTQTGIKRGYDPRNDEAYAHLYQSPQEVKQAK